MAESYVQLPTDGAGKKVRTFQQTVGANVVEHQGFVVCDSSGNIVDVLAAAPAGTERGLAVRQVGTIDPSDRAARLLGHVTVDNASIPVTDNGGSLTVDGSVTADVSDRTARLLGHVTVDNASIPVTDNGGLLSVDDGGGSLTVDGSVTADVSDRAAREVGRVRVWDGVDEATVIPRGSFPGVNDKGLAVMQMIDRRPVYQAVTADITIPTLTAASPSGRW
jgi:hypothetical protein